MENEYINALKCSCGCQKQTFLKVDNSLTLTLDYIINKYKLTSQQIQSGYRCPNSLQILIDKANKGLGNMPAKSGLHLSLPLRAVDIIHPQIKAIFKEMDMRHPTDYGLGLYKQSNMFSMHIDCRDLFMRWVCDNGKYIYSHTNKKEYDDLLRKWEV